MRISKDKQRIAVAKEMPLSQAYSVFGLSPNQEVDPEGLKKLYRKLALENHPDRPTGDRQKFSDISNAYEVLSKYGVNPLNNLENFAEKKPKTRGKKVRHPKATFGKKDKFNYAYNLQGIDSGFLTAPFGRTLDDLKKISNFINDPNTKSFYVSAKGKATLSSVRAWVKERNPRQFFAKWEQDSKWYKEDSVKVYYQD